MHSSYALSSDDFKVERGGKPVKRLADLWPGVPARRPARRGACPADGRGRVLEPDLRHDHHVLRPLREQYGTGNFFRYCDTYLFGVGCEAGDFNQLDIWPLHKWVTILQPTTEALLEAVNDRKVNLLAIPETGARCRGEVVLSTWNAYLSHVKTVVTYSPRTGRARDADVALVGNKVVESYVEQAIFIDPRHRRRLPGEAAPAAAQPRPRREAAGRGVPDAAQSRGRAGAAGRHPGAAARPSGADPARDADHHPPGRGAHASGRRRLRPF